MQKFSSLEVYLKSSLLTFLSAFAIAVIPMIGDASWSNAFWFGLFSAGARAGLKAVLEWLAIMKV